MSEDTVIKVMGVPWDRIGDNLKFDLATFFKQALDGTLTKRKLLSITARFYDPLGFLSPVILPLKCMFQEICQLKIGWVEALPEDLTSRWIELAEDMVRASSIAIPCCVLDGMESENAKSVQSVQLHAVFSPGFLEGQGVLSSSSLPGSLPTP